MTSSWQPGQTLEDVERIAILAAYSFFKTKIHTAAALCISVRTLDAKLEKYAAEGHMGAKVTDAGATLMRQDKAY